MPMGERAFAESRGPWTALTLRVSLETDALLRLTAAETGQSKTGLATTLLERWAEEKLAAHEQQETT